MIVREYHEQDREALLDIWLQASRVGHPFFTEAELVRQREIVREKYIPMAEMWMAEEDGVLLGFIAMLGSMIGGLFVLPSVQGKGVGRFLVGAMAEKKGRLEVGVFEANTGAQRFYAKCGFEPHEEGWNKDVVPEQKVLIWKRRECPSAHF